jgi:hypothetical protein
MWVVGCLAILWFLTRLRAVLGAAEGGTGALSNLVFGAGVVFTAVWMASSAAFAAVGYVVAIVLLFDVIDANIVPLLVWVLAASIVLLMRREEAGTAEA